MNPLVAGSLCSENSPFWKGVCTDELPPGFPCSFDCNTRNRSLVRRVQIKQCAAGEPVKLSRQFATRIRTAGIGSAIVDATECGGPTGSPSGTAGCRTGAASAARRHHVPSGTAIRVRLDTDLGSKISQPGDTFTATVADDVLKDGEVVIPKGARAEGTVIDAKPLGHFKGGALLSVKLERVHTKWGSYPVATSTISRAEQGKGKRSAGFIGGGAGWAR